MWLMLDYDMQCDDCNEDLTRSQSGRLTFKTRDETNIDCNNGILFAVVQLDFCMTLIHCHAGAQWSRDR